VPPKTVRELQAGRLVLRPLGPDDAPFMLRLLNEPSWLQNIGDRGVRTLEDALQYIEQGPRAMYARYGLGLYQLRLSATDEPIGVCGLLKRDALDDVDLGFALLPQYWGQGFAREAAAAVMHQGRRELGLRRIVAIVLKQNDRSRRLLEALGFQLERPIRLAGDPAELLLYGSAG
jgi:RimJ/RimL family protein N-acetyltransferase